MQRPGLQYSGLSSTPAAAPATHPVVVWITSPSKTPDSISRGTVLFTVPGRNAPPAAPGQMKPTMQISTTYVTDADAVVVAEAVNWVRIRHTANYMASVAIVLGGTDVVKLPEDNKAIVVQDEQQPPGAPVWLFEVFSGTYSAHNHRAQLWIGDDTLTDIDGVRTGVRLLGYTSTAVTRDDPFAMTHFVPGRVKPYTELRISKVAEYAGMIENGIRTTTWNGNGVGLTIDEAFGIIGKMVTGALYSRQPAVKETFISFVLIRVSLDEIAASGGASGSDTLTKYSSDVDTAVEAFENYATAVTYKMKDLVNNALTAATYVYSLSFLKAADPAVYAGVITDLHNKCIALAATVKSQLGVCARGIRSAANALIQYLTLHDDLQSRDETCEALAIPTTSDNNAIAFKAQSLP